MDNMTTEDVFERANKLVKNGQLANALEELYLVEKQSRLNADLSLNSRVQALMVDLCLAHGKGGVEDLCALLGVLAKKRGLLKESLASTICRAIEEAERKFCSAAEASSAASLVSLYETIRRVTEGKIFVEVQRARTTRKLAKIYEGAGRMADAFAIMQELQVETFGSMDRAERIDFILEQLRLALTLQEWSKAQIISRKITGKTFEGGDGLESLRLRHADLQVMLALHDNRYLDCSVCLLGIAGSDQGRLGDALRLAAITAILAPSEPAQVSHLARLGADPRYEQDDQLTVYRQILKTFLTAELIDWKWFEGSFAAALNQSIAALFGAETTVRWEHLRQRVTEHNIRTIARYYQSIRLARLAELIGLPAAQAELVLGGMVSTGSLPDARIDQPSGMVSFVRPPAPHQILDDWSRQTDQLLGLLVKTSHQINKEQMVWNLSQQQ